MAEEVGLTKGGTLPVYPEIGTDLLVPWLESFKIDYSTCTYMYMPCVVMPSAAEGFNDKRECRHARSFGVMDLIFAASRLSSFVSKSMSSAILRTMQKVRGRRDDCLYSKKSAHRHGMPGPQPLTTRLCSVDARVKTTEREASFDATKASITMVFSY